MLYKCHFRNQAPLSIHNRTKLLLVSVFRLLLKAKAETESNVVSKKQTYFEGVKNEFTECVQSEVLLLRKNCLE